MRLQILIPHYKECTDDILPLLDSIAIQQSVDFKEIGVIICHDGEESQDFEFTLDESKKGDHVVHRDYPFEVKQIRQDHLGVSAARNACLDESNADYVMFCDADDMFLNVCALYVILREANAGFDTLVSCFVEESRHPETKEIVYINHDMDSTFVHGKVHKRSYLLDRDIRFNPDLTIHEDSYFNILAQNLTQEAKYCPTPFYLWRWRDASVCRHDPEYILKTYNNMLDSNDALIGQFVKRGHDDKANFYVGFMLFDAYYTMNKKEWIDKTNKHYRDSVEKRFSDYYKKHKSRWNKLTDQEKMAISNGVRTRSVMEGMPMETITIDQWLKHIEQLNRK